MALENQEQVIDPSIPVGGDVTPPAVVPVSLKDDDLVEVVVRGETVRKPWKEARAGIQMQDDYTRSKQDLAKRAKEMEDIYSTLTAKQQEIAQKEAAIDAVLGRAPRQQSQQPADDEVITYAQLKSALKAQAEELSTGLTQRQQQAFSENEQAQTFRRWEGLVDETTDKLTKEYPDLQSVPSLSYALKRLAAQHNPQDERELQAAMVKEGKKLAEQFEARYTERRKADAVKKQGLLSKGPEPKGGAPILATTKTYGKDRKVDWKAIEADVIAAIENIED